MKANSVLLLGYVGNHLISKILSTGDKKVLIRVATHQKIKGQKYHITTWHNIVAWDKIGAFAENNFVKGSRILVDGEIIYRTYPDQSGHLRYITEIKANSLENLDR
ncbi:MAG: single-stranded DNA-binding protein [Ferruginibacter sp.]